MTDQPPMLLIYSDQHRFDSLGCHGHPQVHTPHLDRLAREGADFQHAYTPSPICVPARCSLLSGQFPVRHGVLHNFDGEVFHPLDQTLPMHPRVVALAGYTAVHYGRWHVDPESTGTCFGFDEFSQDWRYHHYRQTRGLAPIPSDAGPFGQVDNVTPPGETSLAWHARRVVQRFAQQRQESSAPLFLHWHMMEPHLPCRPTQPFLERYDPATIEPWAGWYDDLRSKPWIQRQMPVTWQIENLSWADWAPVVARYFAAITELDAAIGIVLDGLEELGLLDDTLVVYSSDHGDMCGSHHMLDKHNIMYDDVTRVPLLMRWPGQVPAGLRPTAFVSNAVDLAATFCAVAGAAIPPGFQGVDLRPALHGDDLGRSDIYSSFSGNQFGSCSQRMLRERRWKYIWNATWEDELYDCERDPGECQNLIDDPAAQAELPRLRARLLAWMEAIGDTLLNPWTRTQLEAARILGRTSPDPT